MKQQLTFTGMDTPPIACGEQPQARFEHFGAAALSDTELVALLLQNGMKTPAVVALASALIAEAGSIAGLATWQVTDFRRIRGIGAGKARQLAALFEISRRMMMPAGKALPMMNRPELVAAHLAPAVRGLDIEKFWVLCLNRKNRMKKLVEITSGTATSSLAHPREVFRAAIREGATGVICAHNHPSGDPAPSAADMQITRQLREAAKAVDIDLVDHVVIGSPAADPLGIGYYSFRSAGVL
ncbi:MAG: DNA repair protein RadC [Candidatus Didemnitutus sp.]|nr:DNA repair protein RadC [Candidatus Didemnitutus sp.]